MSLSKRVRAYVINIFPQQTEMGRAGDVLFYHSLCAHAGSMNVRQRPRFAMNMKW